MGSSDIDGMLRRQQLLLDMRPTTNRPLVTQQDPVLRDKALQSAAENAVSLGLGVGTAGLGGPEAITLKSILPGLGQFISDKFRRPDSPQQDVIYPLFHGTEKSFGEYDPTLSKDLGVHFGTLEQAQERIKTWIPEESKSGFGPGANVRPVNVDIEKPARLMDLFSVNAPRKHLVRELLDMHDYLKSINSKEPGLKFSPENEAAMRYWAESGRGTEKDLWDIVEKQAKESGHDAIVYHNLYEGPGDSYIIFDPKKATPRFGKGAYNPQGLK